MSLYQFLIAVRAEGAQLTSSDGETTRYWAQLPIQMMTVRFPPLCTIPFLPLRSVPSSPPTPLPSPRFFSSSPPLCLEATWWDSSTAQFAWLKMGSNQCMQGYSPGVQLVLLWRCSVQLSYGQNFTKGSTHTLEGGRGVSTNVTMSYALCCRNAVRTHYYYTCYLLIVHQPDYSLQLLAPSVHPQGSPM